MDGKILYAIDLCQGILDGIPIIRYEGGKRIGMVEPRIEVVERGKPVPFLPSSEVPRYPELVSGLCVTETYFSPSPSPPPPPSPPATPF
ncbi:MAG: hypothetical protein QXI39_05045 [Candidatus Bathyarchaeia archaeon]